MLQTGATPQKRREFLQRMHNEAKKYLVHDWETEQMGEEVF
jgi:hypothetical protein